MKKIVFLLVMIANVSLFAQKYTIKGIIQDTLNEPLIAATVMLLDVDSVLVEYTQTDAKGMFEFKGVRDQQCIIKTSYLGYFPQTIPIKYTSGNIDLGILRMEEIGKELMEIVIKEAKAPLRLRGDTVEYDASQFKVPEGSTLEDLLRRLPGLEVGQDGSIEADGKGVSKLTVDGKTFFSDDPKFAIKNLPAEGVSKVQVFDKKNEEALLTGKSTATEEKTMNIELKEEFKKGGFGKVTAGGGTESRGELKGNYNKFDSKNQFSLVGVANNTGRNGLSWDDYQDFMGANAWGNNDDYDYGFGRGNRYFGGDGGGSGLENKVSQSFFSGNNGGFPTNLLGGANYNYDHKKNRVASRYFYQNTGNEKQIFSNSRTFLDNFYLDNGRYELDDRKNTNHRAEFVVEHDIDSLFTVIATSDLAFVNNTNTQNGTLSVKRDGNQLTSTSAFENGSELEGQLINASMLLRKKFKKAGRAVGANFSYLSTDVTDNQTRFSTNSFLSSSGALDSLAFLRQYNIDDLNKYVLKANALISEPLSKKFFLKVFYNFSSRNEDGQRIVSDEENQNRVTNNFLSRIYENQIQNHRLGSSLTFSPKIINVTVGAAQQVFDLNGTYRSPQADLFNGKVDNSFKVFLPYFDINANISRNTWISADYSLNVNEPTIENLLPVVDYTNPLYIVEGNPDLLPSRSHDIGTYISHAWPSSGTRIYTNVSYSYFEDQIINDQTVDNVNLVTSSKPVNYTGGNQFWSNAGLSFPIIRNKVKARLNASYTGSKSFAFVNDVLNTTDTKGKRGNINLDITPADGVAIYLSANLSTSNTAYDIDKTQDQTIVRNNYNVEFNSKLGKGWFWNSSLAYSIFTNERFGMDQEIPILNMSIYKQFLKGNRGELRLSLYDAFDKNELISQSTSPSRVFDSRTPSLARYGMLSFSYNIKGMKSSVERKNYWY